MKSKNDKQKKGKGKKKVEDNSSLFSYMPSEEQIYEIKSSFTKKNIILFCIISSIFLMIFFQYQYERKHQIGYTSDEDSTEEDYYQILGLEPGTDIFTIRKQYKKLAKIWHPDKHPDCKICKEKFAKIPSATIDKIENCTTLEFILNDKTDVSPQISISFEDRILTNIKRFM